MNNPNDAFGVSVLGVIAGLVVLVLCLFGVIAAVSRVRGLLRCCSLLLSFARSQRRTGRAVLMAGGIQRVRLCCIEAGAAETWCCVLHSLVHRLARRLK